MVVIKVKFEGAIKRMTVLPEQLTWSQFLDALKQIYGIESAEFLTCSFQMESQVVLVRTEQEFEALVERIKAVKQVMCLLEQTLTLQYLLERLLQVPGNAEVLKDVFTRYTRLNPNFKIEEFLEANQLSPRLSLDISRIHSETQIVKPSASQFRLMMVTENGRQVLKAVPATSHIDYSTVHLEDLRASLPPKVLDQVAVPIHCDLLPEESNILDGIGSEESEDSGTEPNPQDEDKRLLMDHESDDDLELQLD